MDSGIGGLSVLKEICRQLPALSFDYLADYAFLPYGGKSEPELQQRIKTLLNHLDVERRYCAIVIACNSASTVVLEYLRQQFALPFIGVVPAIKVAAEITKNNVIGLLATKGTVQREYTQKLIDDFTDHCRVVKLAAPQLVEIAESKFISGRLDLDKLREVVQPLLQEKIDTCVLGCTHFSWVQQELQQIAPQVRWIDSRDAIARRVGFILREELGEGLSSQIKSRSSVFISTLRLSGDLLKALETNQFSFDAIKVLHF